MPLTQSPVYNRIEAIMSHLPYYGFNGRRKLAADGGVPKRTVARLLLDQDAPTIRTVFSITKAFERRLGRPISPWEIFSCDGTYPTESICLLVGCPGCWIDKTARYHTRYLANQVTLEEEHEE